jgi:hypothetical protein
VSGRALVHRWREALVRDSDLDSTARLVGFVISTHMQPDGSGAFPSTATIATEAGLGSSARTVIKAVRDLEQAGFLHVTRSKGRHSHRYLAVLPTVHQRQGSTLSLGADQPCLSPTSTLSQGHSNKKFNKKTELEDSPSVPLKGDEKKKRRSRSERVDEDLAEYGIVASVYDDAQPTEQVQRG